MYACILIPDHTISWMHHSLWFEGEVSGELSLYYLCVRNAVMGFEFSNVWSPTGFCCAYLIFISENLSDYINGMHLWVGFCCILPLVVIMITFDLGVTHFFQHSLVGDHAASIISTHPSAHVEQLGYIKVIIYKYPPLEFITGVFATLPLKNYVLKTCSLSVVSVREYLGIVIDWSTCLIIMGDSDVKWIYVSSSVS